MLKKGVSISLLLVLLYNLGGYFAAFRFIQGEWRSYVKQQLYSLVDKENIVTFTFSKTSFDVSQDEFVKNGRYYDVIKHEIEGDFVKVYCFDDSTETRMVVQFYDILNQNITQETDFQSKTTWLLSCLVKEYIFETPFSIESSPSVSESKNGDFSFNNCFHLNRFHLIEAPPPKRFSI